MAAVAWSRVVVWTWCCLAAGLLMCAPLLQRQTCFVASWEETLYNHELSPESYIMFGHLRGQRLILVGSHFGSAFVAGGLAVVLLDPKGRLNVTIATHRWVRRYGCFAGAQCCFLLAIPWIFQACPKGMVPSVYMALNFFAFISHSIAKGVLCFIGIIRLEKVAAEKYSARARRWFRVVFLLGICTVTFIWSPLSSLPHADIIFVGLACTIFGSYMFMQIQLFRGFTKSARDAAAEAAGTSESHGVAAIAKRAQWTASLLGLSACTTLLYIIIAKAVAAMEAGLIDAETASHMHWLAWVYELVAFFDLTSDAALALLCAGLVGPAGDRRLVGVHSEELRALGKMVQERRQRQILDTIKKAADAVSGPAVTLAAMFEGVDEKELLLRASSRFRCISWEVLAHHRDLVVGADAIEGHRSDRWLYRLSEPCDLASCDAFWSHSWHDDGLLVWEALKAWCEAFVRDQGRCPRLWFDKVCIDQCNIKNDLQCLPIFLAGCDVFLITCGLTYTRRLWCCVELFVFMSMSMEDEAPSLPVVRFLGAGCCERQAVVDTWRDFDVRSCECYKEEDKLRILATIDKRSAGTEEFNDFIHHLAQEVFCMDGVEVELATSGEAERCGERRRICHIV